MAEEIKKTEPEETDVKEQAEELAEKEVAAIKADVDAKLAEMEKDYEAKKAELEKEFEEKKAALIKELEARRVQADDFAKHAQEEVEAHKKEIVCGICIAAAGSLIAGLVMAALHHDR